MNKEKIKIDTINLYEEIYKINMILSSLEKEYINIRDITVTSLDEVDNSYNYYKDFEKNIFELYSWVYTKCITPYYQILIGARPNLTAANFTKVNVHFEHIIGDIINDKIFNGDAFC